MNTKHDLIEYVRKNWEKIPYLCTMPEEGIQEFLEKGGTYMTGRNSEHIQISRRSSSKGDFYVIASYVYGYDEEKEADEYFLTSQMSFEDNGIFSGTLYGNEDISFSIDNDGIVNFKNSYRNRDELLKLLQETKAIATHFGDDLDNKSAIYGIEHFLRTLGVLKQNENLSIERVPAGQVKIGSVNIDTGGHRGNKFDDETGTIVIDGDPKNGIKSACQSLYNLGIYIPEQICELADSKPTSVSALDSRSGLSLVRYLSGKQAFDLAENYLLDKTLTDEQLKEYGLVEAHLKQQQIIDNAVEKINTYTFELPNGEKIVLALEQITAGSSIAYEMGIPYYASTNQHYDKAGNPDGVTFAISCKPGLKLPKQILEYGRQLVEKYRKDEQTSDVFITPNEQLIVAGGPKNPDFKIEGYTPTSMLEELKAVLSSSRDSAYISEIVNYANCKALLNKKIESAKLSIPDNNKQQPAPSLDDK